MEINMISTNKIYNESRLFFVTSTIVNGIPVFVNEDYYKILINALKFYQINNGLLIYAYVLIENQFNLIISNENVSKIMQSFKKYTAKEIISRLQEDKKYSILKEFRDVKPDYKITSLHQIWQEGFNPEEIISLKMLYQKIEYIHNKPVRKNLVFNPEDWEYSSAANYLFGSKEILKITRIM